MLSDVTGHEHAIGLLRSHLDDPMPSYIFHGPSGVGKRFLASMLFQEIACQAGRRQGCTCRSCVQVNEGSHADLRMVVPAKASYGIAQVQEILDECHEYPDAAPRKIYVLDDADKLTPNAANAFLKVLEDGPPRTMFILIVEDERDLIDTIRSRSISIRFSELTPDSVRLYLSKYSSNEDMVRLCANLSGGSIGTALSYIREGHLGMRDEVLEFLQMLHRKPYHQVIDAVDNVENATLLFYLWRHLFADLNRLEHGLEGHVANFDKVTELEAIRKRFGPETVLAGVNELNRLYTNMPRIKATFSVHLKSALLNIRRTLNGKDAR